MTRSSLARLPALTLALGLSAGSAQAQAIRIGVNEPLTGPFAASGTYVVNGAKIAADEINAKGGVLGRTLELVIEDNKSNPTEAAAVAEKLITSDKTPVLMGAWGSSLTLAVMPKLADYETAMLVETSSSGKITTSGNPFVFRISPPSALEAEAFAPLVEKIGLKKVDFLAINNDWGRGAAADFTKMLKGKGVAVGLVETMDQGAQDMSAQLSKLKGSDADTIMITAAVDQLTLLFKQMAALGLKKRVITTGGSQNPDQIIAQAGRFGGVTIATNMAGRGTDIKLGGNVEMRVEKELAGLPEGPERDAKIEAIKAEIAENRDKVLASGEPADPAAGRKVALPGGLYIIGTERHESRRIDNQLRGRSGRQGDPGRSKFYLSLQDDLMRILGSDRMDGMLQRLGLEQGEAIIHPWINKAIEKAQQKVEARNFDMRKNVLKYDNVMNDQRKVVFEQRRDFMGQESVRETVDEMRHGVVDDLVAVHVPENAYAEQWDAEGLKHRALDVLGLDENADSAAIKAQYKTLVKRFHPDANGGDRSFEERLRDIIRAHDVLRAAGLC